MYKKQNSNTTENAVIYKEEMCFSDYAKYATEK
jgi:hypothetical protein